MEPHELRMPKGVPSSLGRWLMPAVAAALFAALVVPYLRYTAAHTPYAGTTIGRWYYGMAALVTLLFLTFYNVRHNTYRARMGSLQTWFWGHLWIGIVCLAAFAFHCGFRVHGLFNWLLTIAFLAETASGFIGLFFYLTVRPRLVQREEQPLYASHLVTRIHDLKEQVRSLQEGKSPQLARAVNEVASAMESKANPLSVLFSSFNRAQFEAFVRSLREQHAASVPAEERAIFGEITVALQNLSLSRTQLFLHRLLRGWLPLHVALAGVLLALVAIHLITVGYY